jgi:hypothetical protein
MPSTGSDNQRKGRDQAGAKGNGAWSYLRGFFESDTIFEYWDHWWDPRDEIDDANSQPAETAKENSGGSEIASSC